MSMNSAAEATRNSGDYDNEEAMAASRSAELLAAASEGRGDEVVRILEADPELLRVGDPVGDTALHVLVRVGHVAAFNQLIRFIWSHHHYKALLSMVATQENGHGDTPLHLAIENRHRGAAFLFYKAELLAKCIVNDSGDDDFLELEAKEVLFDDKDEMLERNEDEDKLACTYEQLSASMHQRKISCITVPAAALSDIEMEIVRGCKQGDEILDMSKADLSLIRHKVGRGNTILHEAAASGNTNMLSKLVAFLISDDPRLNLLLERNQDGDTPLHLALSEKHTKAARYLIEVAPEAAYQVNKSGLSPLSLMLGQDDLLVQYVLQVMPEASISPATRHALLTPHEGSLPHTAIRARNLTMLQMILGSIPCLIDSPDEKRWKPLSYAAFKGYLEDVRYLLNKFPESIKRIDGDGSLPIHKAVSGGHISIIKEFISSHPQSLSAIDKKGRSVLHIAVRYAKADILKYLIHETDGIQKIRDLRDHDGKTFEDYAKELKRN